MNYIFQAVTIALLLHHKDLQDRGSGGLTLDERYISDSSIAGYSTMYSNVHHSLSLRHTLPSSAVLHCRGAVVCSVSGSLQSDV